MKKMIGAALLLSTSTAFAASTTTHYTSMAAMPKGQAIGYLTDTKIDTPFGSDSSIGFGVRGWFGLPNTPFFLHGEFQQADTNPSDQSLRIGGGVVGPIQNNLMWLGKIEYLELGHDGDEGGFGIHGGLLFDATPQLNLFGTLGYLDTDHTDGFELDLGAQFHLTRELALVGDFRTYRGSISSVDFNLDDFRIGLGYTFW